MQKNLLLFLSLSAFAFFFFTSSSGGRAAAANQGNTGAPGDNPNTCITCHNSGSIQVDLNIEFQDVNGNEVDAYIPGQNYKVKVIIEDVGNQAPRAHGFQIVCLDAPLDVNGSDIKNWIDSTSNNYKISNARGRQYVEHDRPSTSNEFVIDWKAPLTSSGQVSFYACGNGVNLNGGTSGDGASIDKIEIPQSTTTSTLGLQKIQYNLSPNPVSDRLNIALEEPFSGQIELYDLYGHRQYFTTESAILNHQIFLSDAQIHNGVYQLVLTNQNGQRTTASVLVQ